MPDAGCGYPFLPFRRNRVRRRIKSLILESLILNQTKTHADQCVTGGGYSGRAPKRWPRCSMRCRACVCVSAQGTEGEKTVEKIPSNRRTRRSWMFTCQNMNGIGCISKQNPDAQIAES